MRPAGRGFTLLELLVVIAIIAIATAAVSLSLRDDRDSALERESLRLGTLLEVARARSRATGTPITWQASPQGYTFSGVPSAPSNDTDQLHPFYPWLSDGMRAQIESPATARELLLGPEPVIPVQTVVLRLEEREMRLGTDGLRPFGLVSAPVSAPASGAAP